MAESHPTDKPGQWVKVSARRERLQVPSRHRTTSPTAPPFTGNPANLLSRLEIVDASSPSKPDNYKVSPISSSTDFGFRNTVWENWSGRGSHVDFRPDELVPLKQERFLGHGVMGNVYETHCQGVAFAWKRRYCRRKIGDAERKEIEILKRLSHEHIVRLVGTYTHKQFLGMLLYPVAVCDMATFFDVLEALYAKQPLEQDHKDCLSALDLPPRDMQISHADYLYPKFGCILAAIEYLHSQSIRHKDLKPANILLGRGNQVWLTDFGSATDFSMLSHSETENGERGTPRYFAPEVAEYRPSGRAADIFSLGCVFLEMAALFLQGTLANIRSLRPSLGSSFQANLDRAPEWIRCLRTTSPRFQHLLTEIELMLSRDPTVRPTAPELHQRFLYINQFGSPGSPRSLFGQCCSQTFLTREEVNTELQSQLEQHEETVRALNSEIMFLQERKFQRERIHKEEIGSLVGQHKQNKEGSWFSSVTPRTQQME